MKRAVCQEERPEDKKGGNLEWWGLEEINREKTLDQGKKTLDQGKKTMLGGG